MPSDIFLKQDRIEAVTTNETSFDVTTEKNETPDIELAPNSASLRLGGGGGEYSDGDIRLLDRPGDDDPSEPRIHLTGGQGKTHDGTRVRVNGTQGFVKLGAKSVQKPDVELLPDSAELRLGGGGAENSNGNFKLIDAEGTPRIHAEAYGFGPVQPVDNGVYITAGGPDDAGEIHLGEVGEERASVSLLGGSGQLTLGGVNQSGNLIMYRQGLVSTIGLNGHAAHVGIGGRIFDGDELVDAVPGSIDVDTDEGETGVALEGTAADADGARIAVANSEGAATVDAAGGRGTVTLGNGDAGDEGIAGTLTLDDGDGMSVDLAADGGTVTLGHHDATAGAIGLELEPADGVFRVVDGDGDPVFRIDTQEKSIETGKKYKRGVINDKGP